MGVGHRRVAQRERGVDVPRAGDRRIEDVPLLEVGRGVSAFVGEVAVDEEAQRQLAGLDVDRYLGELGEWRVERHGGDVAVAAVPPAPADDAVP